MRKKWIGRLLLLLLVLWGLGNRTALEAQAAKRGFSYTGRADALSPEERMPLESAGNGMDPGGQARWEEGMEEEIGQRLLEELDFDSVEKAVEDMLHTEFGFEDTVVPAEKGENLLSPEALVRRAIDQIRGEWKQQKGAFLSVLALAVCTAFLTNFSRIFKSQQIAEISFEIAYMLLFLILLRSFEQASQATQEVLTAMQDFMKALIPAYFLSVTMASSPVTAGIFYPFVLAMIYAIRWVMDILLLPLLDGYVILVFVNHLTKEEYLSQLTEVISKGIGWILKSMLALIAGFHVIQGIISPAVDSFKTTALSRAASAIPGVGNLAGSVTDVLLGSGILIKNGIGAAGLVVLLMLCLMPVVQMGTWVLVLEVAAAVVQPVSDKRMTGCIAGISDAGKLLLRMVFTSAALFMLTIAVVAVSTGIR